MSTGASVRLIVDGEAVEPRFLHRTVLAVARSLAGAGAGPGHPVTADSDPIATIVAAMAAETIGAPVTLTSAGTVGPRRADATACAVVERVGVDVSVRVLRPVPDRVSLPEATAAVFATSGSSGDPKQVALSRATLDYQASATRARLDIDERDGLCVPLPLHHAYGFAILQIWRLAGARLYVETSFRPARIAGLLATGALTSLDGVPAMYASLLAHATRNPHTATHLRALRIRGCGGDVLPAVLQARFRDRTGVPIHDGYGLTEAGPNVAISGPGTWRPDAIGPPLEGTDVRLSTDGELLVRGPGVMLGYVADPAATAQAIDADGWLRTGDLATIGRDGYVTVHGRSKEVLVIHGETFAPADVEAALIDCGGIREACVVGQRSGHVRGDRVVAFIVADHSSRTTTTTADVRREIRTRLPAQLRPAEFRFVDALPRLSTGKIDRQALRQRTEPVR